MESNNWKVKRKNTWIILVEYAKNNKTITYGELGKQAGGVIAVHVGEYLLKPILQYCDRNNLPPLTVIVTNKRTGKANYKDGVNVILKREGKEPIKEEEEAEKIRQVYDFNWEKLENPFISSVVKSENKKAKHLNDDFESKKGYERYRKNKQNLKGFDAAERFLLRLESMDNGFYISPRTNLHCYYKDRYLFYLHDFGQVSIKVRQRYNNIINKGTFDYSYHFFAILKSKIQAISEGLTATDLGGCTYEVGNTGKASDIFDIILSVMHEVALEIDNHSKEKQEEDFEKKIKAAQKLTPEERLNKLKKSPDYPESSEKTIIIYNRNQYVVAEILERANGKCAFCRQDAPFVRNTDKTPFLEVHHIVPISNGGKDTIDNAIALCPNCHRKAHYGDCELINDNETEFEFRIEDKHINIKKEGSTATSNG